MYKGNPYTNRLIQKREEERSLGYHRNNLRNIKPKTNVQESAGIIQLNNGKKQYQNEIKFTEIERENRLLLQKISSIMNKTKRLNNTQNPNNPWRNRNNKSLNSTYRKKQLQEIQIENTKLVRRLQDKKSDYDIDRMNDEWKKQKNVMKIRSLYSNMDKSPGKRNSMMVLNSKASKSPRGTYESCRVKVINGFNFVVTVKLTPRMLHISGDTKQSPRLKIIEIQREEALQFIDEQCQGRIQLIFDRLRYDKQEESLYLVSNDVTLDELIHRENGNKKSQIKKEEKKEDKKQDENDYDKFSEDNEEKEAENPEKKIQHIEQQKKSTIKSNKNKQTIKSNKSEIKSKKQSISDPKKQSIESKGNHKENGLKDSIKSKQPQKQEQKIEQEEANEINVKQKEVKQEKQDVQQEKVQDQKLQDVKQEQVKEDDVKQQVKEEVRQEVKQEVKELVKEEFRQEIKEQDNGNAAQDNQ